MMAPYRMVLSATIERDDQNETLIYKMCGDKVYEISFYDLVKESYLSPVKVEFIEVPLPPDEKQKYEELEREIENVKSEFGKIYRKYEHIAYANGYDDVREYLRKTRILEYVELNSKALSLRQRMRILEQRNSNKIAIAVELANKHIEEGNKVFIFTNLIEQAEKIFSEISKSYKDAKLVTSKTSQDEREQLFRLFSEGRLRCIVTTTVLDEGIDAPDADVGIVVSSRALRHPRQFVQRIGRIVRPKPGKISHIYILRTAEGIEEITLDELRSELDKVYQFSEMEKLIGSSNN